MKLSKQGGLYLAGLLVVSLLLSGCYLPPRFYLDGHRGYQSGRGSMDRHPPDVTLSVGESILAVRPARALGPTGYWHSVWVEDPEVVRVEGEDGSLMNGTRIVGVKEGRTRAFYTNAAFIYGAESYPEERDRLAESIEDRRWFWIEVKP
ncbi:MAG: hypothetical protein JJT75_08215 [Opitutales bacterium]|nr:hypothetical protein [Opitutales bacterium]MCH8539752.1 hypothetical protein [Opitutales bacterium]